MAEAKQKVKTSSKETAPAGKLGRDRTLSDRVYEKILSMIVRGETPVGAKLPTEHALSEQLEVSRPVLRQALKQLREDGVIVSRQGSGSFVQRRPEGAVLDFAPVGSIADIQRTFEFRAAVEGEAAYLAAERRTDTDLAKLRAVLDELDRCIQEGELGVDADETFHEVICTASGNQYFTAARTSMKANILTGLNLTRNLSLTKPQERLELVQREHYQIFEAIKNRNQEEARAAMRAHVENARKRVFEG
ncbi:FadR/GntR family transcriptional regulator [Shimia thalassica]|uniref:FadR/GntR family transcriptional regulator n=1 Tax=Shimia thalassica TaxID=1715693 RepID=UPI0026E37E57|nr:FadR/GntR family transcriptional regulator [Shimia thalassica]MDO6523765.1 FadR/GntR family transcriptional regulator [Shimia thalassica]